MVSADSDFFVHILDDEKTYFLENSNFRIKGLKN